MLVTENTVDKPTERRKKAAVFAKLFSLTNGVNRIANHVYV